MPDTPELRYRVEVSQGGEIETEDHPTMATALRSLLARAEMFDSVAIVDTKSGREVALYNGELERTSDTVELLIHRPDKGWTCHWQLILESLKERIISCPIWR